MHTFLRAEGKKEGSEVWLNCIFYSAETFQRKTLRKESVNGAGNLKVPLQKKRGGGGRGVKKRTRASEREGEEREIPLWRRRKGQQYTWSSFTNKKRCFPGIHSAASIIHAVFYFLLLRSVLWVYIRVYIYRLSLCIGSCVMCFEMWPTFLHFALKTVWLFRAFHRAKRTSRFCGCSSISIY